MTLPNGKYVLIFMYDSNKYALTTYQSNGVPNSMNSDVVTRNITVNNQKTIVGATDEISLTNNLKYIDIGLIEKEVFDMKLEKFVKEIIVTNTNGTKKYTQDVSETLAKVEIPSKVLKGSNVVITYTFKVTNVGNVEGYVNDIVDYLPKSLNFSSSLNPDWYQTGEYIYNSSLTNELIKPGESKEITLTVTRTMTNSNTELVENRAEIEMSKNSLGLVDQTADNAKAEVLLGISTGSVATYIAITLAITLAISGITYIVYKKYFNKRIKI